MKMSKVSMSRYLTRVRRESQGDPESEIAKWVLELRRPSAPTGVGFFGLTLVYVYKQILQSLANFKNVSAFSMVTPCSKALLSSCIMSTVI